MPEGQPATGAWRIDELAQRAGLSVDTIRYYAREGLFQPPERSGRHRLYGPEHLERLTRIRELQEQRFSLAAIRAILTPTAPASRGSSPAPRPQLHARRTSRTVRASTRSSSIGCAPSSSSPTPRRSAATTYDDDDLALLRAVAELQEIGMTESILVDLGRDLRSALPRVASRRARRCSPATTATGTTTSSSRSSGS